MGTSPPTLRDLLNCHGAGDNHAHLADRLIAQQRGRRAWRLGEGHREISFQYVLLSVCRA